MVGNWALSTDIRADVEQGTAGGADIEEETVSFHRKPAPLYNRDPSSVYNEADSSSSHADASLSLEMPPNLKETRISRFLWIRKLLMLAILFSASLSMVFTLFAALPKSTSPGVVSRDLSVVVADGDAVTEVGQNPQLVFSFPKDLQELKIIRGTLEVYQKEHRRQVQIGIICLYLFLQTFMIPGSIFLNLLAGSLYDFYEALFLVLVLAAAGSSLCYCLSNYILKEIVYYYFSERCDWLAREVHRHRHHLLNYMLFLRLTPILPNWFINVASPLVGVPYRDFVIGTAVGLVPASIVGVKAGSILSTINSLNDLYDFRTIATISFIAVLVMLPVVIKGRHDWARVPTMIKTI